MTACHAHLDLQLAVTGSVAFGGEVGLEDRLEAGALQTADHRTTDESGCAGDEDSRKLSHENAADAAAPAGPARAAGFTWSAAARATLGVYQAMCNVR